MNRDVLKSALVLMLTNCFLASGFYPYSLVLTEIVFGGSCASSFESCMAGTWTSPNGIMKCRVYFYQAEPHRTRVGRQIQGFLVTCDVPVFDVSISIWLTVNKALHSSSCI